MKQGYILTDKDFPLQTFSYSTNDIVIVIERASDRIRQKNEIVRRLSVSNEDAFVKNNAEIERLKAEGSKTQKELARLRALYKKEHENNRKLIDQMAEKLVSIDYDNLDRLNSQVTELISKGMIEDAKKLLASADNDYVNDISKKNKSLAATYYNRFIINSLDNKYDDAADNIVKRADLDLHNIGWQLDAGVFFMKRHQGQKAIDILRRAIEKNKKRDNCDNNAQIAMVYNNLGLLYLEQKHHEKAEKCFNKALTIFEKYAEDNPEYYKPLIAALQSNLGIIYSDNYFEKSETKYKKALDYYSHLAANDTSYYQHEAATLEKMAILYGNNNRMTDSEIYHMQAIGIYRNLANNVSEDFNADLAHSLNNISVLYYRNKLNVGIADKFRDEALSLEKNMAEKDPDLYEPAYAAMLFNYAQLSYENEDYNKATDFLKLSIDVYRSLASNEVDTFDELTDDKQPDQHQTKLAESLFMQAMLLQRTRKYDESEQSYSESLAIYDALYDDDGSKYKKERAKLMRNKAFLLEQMERFKEAGELYKKELTISDDLARSYGNLSFNQLLNGDFHAAKESAELGLKLNPDKKFIWSNLAAADLLLGNFKEAKEIYTTHEAELGHTFVEDLERLKSLNVVPADRTRDVQKILRILKNQQN